MPRSVRRSTTASTHAAGEKKKRPRSWVRDLSKGNKLLWTEDGKPRVFSRLQMAVRGDEILIVKEGLRGKYPQVLGVLDRESLSFEERLARLSKGVKKPLAVTEVVGVKPPVARVYKPDARTRALLRGRRIAEQDIESSGGAVGLAEVRQIMNGVTRQAVTNRVKEGSLLAVPGPSNRRIYPFVQFVDGGSPVKGLKEVRDALGTTSGVAILNFLVNKEPRLGGRLPIDLLKAGDLDRVLEVARRSGIQGA